MLGTGRLGSTLGDRTGSGSEGSKAREDWVLSTIRQMDRMGVRPAFDELVIDLNPDYGPPWLDRLITREGREIDRRKLALALKGLFEICGIDRLVADATHARNE
jgi:hypothetical protein